MSSSLNSRTSKPVPRCGSMALPSGAVCACGHDACGLLRAIAAAPLMATSALADQPLSADPLAGMLRWGSGEFRRFGFLVYEATLWAGSDPLRPPLALRLDYKRRIVGADIVEASIAEMRRLGTDDRLLARWGERMARLFPDVRAGDHILGLHREDGASFIYNGKMLGTVDDAEFARRFFAIWLDPRSSAPELRGALLKRPGA